MKPTSLKISLALTALAFCFSCMSRGSSESAEQSVSEVDTSRMTPVELTDLSAIAVSASALTDSGADSVLRHVATPITALMRLVGAGDTADAVAVRAYASGRVMKMFYPEVHRAFPSTDSLNRVLTLLGARFAKLLPDVAFPRLYGVVSPYNQSVIMVGDSVSFLVMNHYLGPEHPAYNGFAEYVRRNKTSGRIPLDMAEAIVSTTLPYDAGETPTVLSRLLYEGAVVEAVMQLGGVSEAEALSYTPDEMAWANENEAAAWDALLKRRMLFSTDQEMAVRLTAPMASTSILNAESPGRLGRFIGHRIVAAYLRANPSTKLADLLRPAFYASPSTLSAASYPR